MERLSRRAVLRAAGVLAGGAALAACGRASPPKRRTAAGLLPLHDDLAVDGGRPLERGATLRIYEWRDYLSADVVDAFARRHAGADVGIEIESFTTMAQAVERLRGPDGG